MLRKLILTTALFASITSPALAERKPVPGPVDSRIRTVVYNPHDVVDIKGHYFIQTVIKFSPDEIINEYAVGENEWRIRHDESGHKLWIKPLTLNSRTNLTVVTNKRTYYFNLTASEKHSFDKKSNNVAYAVEFVYPDENALHVKIDPDDYNLPKESDKAIWNYNYSFAGDRKGKPQRAYDDGEFTYFEFTSRQDIPAAFSVAPDGTESVVNHRMEGRTLIIHSVGDQFTLRSKDHVTCIFNNGIEKADGGPLSLFGEGA